MCNIRHRRRRDGGVTSSIWVIERHSSLADCTLISRIYENCYTKVSKVWYLGKMGESEIATFYANRSILITGSTGFLGKALVEKFLRSIPDIRWIYLLIRAGKNQTAEERWQKIVDSDLFEMIRKTSSDEGKSAFGKIRVINGDMMEPELGISREDAQEIRENVSVVFHCAATIRLDEQVRNVGIFEFRALSYVLEHPRYAGAKRWGFEN